MCITRQVSIIIKKRAELKIVPTQLSSVHRVLQRHIHCKLIRSYNIGLAPGLNVLEMNAFSDLVAKATGAESTISLQIWLILKVFHYTVIYGFRYPFLICLLI